MANQFLIKSTVSGMRAISTSEVNDLQTGIYEGLLLLGYYEKGDTPAPIVYYLSDTTESDDGGSVFEVGLIKLEHAFKESFDIAYFGGNLIASCGYSNRSNKNIKLTSNVTIEASVITPIPCPSGIESDSRHSINILGGYYFDLENAPASVELKNITFKVEGLNVDENSNSQPKKLFHLSNVIRGQINNLFVQNCTYEGIVPSVTGEIRARGFIDINHLSKGIIENSVFNNVDIAITIRQSENIRVINTCFANTGTGIYGDNVTDCAVYGCSLRNTVEQTGHWRGKLVGQDLNGRDLIFAMGNRIEVLNCRSYNPIERLCYLIADNTVIKDNYSLNGDGFKSVGNSTDVKQNILIENNHLELDDDNSGRFLSIGSFTQVYWTENTILRGNTFRFIGVDQTNNTLKSFVRIANRYSKNVVVENNFCEKVTQGFVRIELKTPEEYANDSRYCVDGLKVLNNRVNVGGIRVIGAIVNTDRKSGYYATVYQWRDVEIVNNTLAISSAVEVSPDFLYDISCVDGLYSEGNKKVAGDFYHANGFMASVPTTYNNIKIVEDSLTCRNINSNLISLRGFKLNSQSHLKFFILDSPDSISWRVLDSAQTLGEGAVTTIEKYSKNQLNLSPTTSRECIIDCYIKNEGYSKIRLASGAFTDIIGTRNVDLIKWSGGNLAINSGGIITEDYALKIDIM